MKLMKEHGTWYVSDDHRGRLHGSEGGHPGYFPPQVAAKATAIGPLVLGTAGRAYLRGRCMARPRAGLLRLMSAGRKRRVGRTRLIGPTVSLACRWTPACRENPSTKAEWRLRLGGASLRAGCQADSAAC